MLKILITILISALLPLYANDNICKFVKGNVKLFRSNVETLLKSGDLLSDGDRIKAAKDSLAILKYEDSVIKIDANSEVVLKKAMGAPPEVSVNIGSVVINKLKKKIANSNKDAPSLVVNTRNASMGVRGTTFFVYQGQGDEVALNVQKGVVTFKGERSSADLPIESGSTAMVNKEKKNIKPRVFGWEKQINYELKNTKNLEQPITLSSVIEASWQQYKEEQEFLWEQKKQEDEDQWNKWKSMNGGL